MNFLLDESTEVKIAAILEASGHNVKIVFRDFPVGLRDAEVLALAQSEQRILLTKDRDFGELVFRQRLPHAGVIYFRFPLDSTADQKISALERLLATHHDRLNHFLVVTPRGVRVRRSPTD